MRSKRFEALAKRPVNQDGFVKEWIEEGFIAMESPNDPKPLFALSTAWLLNWTVNPPVNLT